MENNNNPKTDFDELGVELKCTGMKYFKNEKLWVVKERLVFNIFDFNEEYKLDFESSSFLKKSKLVELMLYKYDPVSFYKFEGKEYPTYPDFEMTNSVLFNLHDLLDQDLAI